jgi:hypothetical protein
MADKLTSDQVFSLLLKGGFNREDAITMTAIARAESALDPAAVGDVSLQNGTWGPSVGLFQIRTLKRETGTGSDRDIRHLTGDPAAQVKAALAISGDGRNFRPWSTFTSGSYRKFLDNDLREVPVPAGAGSGLEAGGGSQPVAEAVAAPVDPFAVDRGRPAIKVADRDGDGLTDRFERLLGTDRKQSDTDADGLTDTYEAGTSHTDPLSKDTDGDGLTDGAEVGQGTDAGRAELPESMRKAGFGGFDSLDSDSDGLSDGYEKQHGTNPLKADSDSDGLSDGDEAARGLDARSLDSDRDGLSDGFAVQNLPGAPGGPAGSGVPDLPDDPDLPD